MRRGDGCGDAPAPMDTQRMVVTLAAGFALMALGAGMSRERDASRSGVGLLGRAVQGLGLALLSWVVWRLLKAA